MLALETNWRHEKCKQSKGKARQVEASRSEARGRTPGYKTANILWDHVVVKTQTTADIHAATMKQTNP